MKFLSVKLIKDELCLLRTMKAIYLEDSYLKDFEAVVLTSSVENITLDRTAFYPQSGGQPSDYGILVHGDNVFKVCRAELLDGQIMHIMDRKGLMPGDHVRASLEWERRHLLMRNHTACHILSAVIFKETGAKITGNQIDVSKSRVDFSLENFLREKMDEYVKKANLIIEENHPVTTEIIPKKDAMMIPDLMRLAMEVPDREEIRIVKIEGVDLQACGGTHVKNTSEIGKIKIIKAENKGKANRRVYFLLED
jgi:misacylated tRNA(Ala) deacylase